MNRRQCAGGFAFGPDQAFYEKVKTFLDEKNPNGDNATANLLLELMDKIYAGEKADTGAALASKADKAFGETYGAEIEASSKADAEKRQKFQKQMDATREGLSKQKEVLQDKIKKLQEQLRGLQVDGGNRLQNASQVRQVEKELEALSKQLSAVNTSIRNASGMPPEINWDDSGIIDW